MALCISHATEPMLAAIGAKGFTPLVGTGEQSGWEWAQKQKGLAKSC